MTVGVSSKFKTILKKFTQPNIRFSGFGAKNSPVCWLVSGCQFLPSKKIKSCVVFQADPGIGCTK